VEARTGITEHERKLARYEAKKHAAAQEVADKGDLPFLTEAKAKRGPYAMKGRDGSWYLVHVLRSPRMTKVWTGKSWINAGEGFGGTSGWANAKQYDSKSEAERDLGGAAKLTESETQLINDMVALIKKSRHNFAKVLGDPKKAKEAESMMRGRIRMMAPMGTEVSLKVQREIVKKAMEKADPELAKKFYGMLGSYKAPKRKKRPTFKAAKAAIMDHLDKEGWTVVRRLKVPHATDMHKDNRLWFKSQAVYLGGGKSPRLGDARSLHIDIRDVSPEQFMSYLKRWMD